MPLDNVRQLGSAAAAAQINDIMGGMDGGDARKRKLPPGAGGMPVPSASPSPDGSGAPADAGGSRLMDLLRLFGVIS